ncbi:MAG TPA: hypothetical protein VL486_13675 [Verrucomicrobiae bacterium]|nr:hypothetical protein [Verrucomicrobiae bacterium]
MTDNPSPTGLAIVICDQIIEDKFTGKKSLIGIFNQIGTQTFPCRHPQLCVFVSLTEGRGQCAARLRIIHDQSEHVVAEVNGNIQFSDVHVVVELNFNLVGLTFPEPGMYSIEFYCDDALILERRFNVVKMQPQPPPKGPPPAEM